MRDPYHSARQRFKVARDRAIEFTLRCAGQNSPDAHRQIQQRASLRWLASSPICHNTPGLDASMYEAVEAAGILHTMLTFKITDERQALMLWKLSRDN